MNKRLLILSFCFSVFALQAQLEPNNHQVEFELGQGLNFRFQENAYQFKISGMMQPQALYEEVEGSEYALFLNSRRTYLNFSGTAREEKLSFFMQMDFSDNSPLLDAWVAYHPWENWSIALGQKQNVGNNREMLIMENYLSFPDRSLLSRSLSNSGREMGVFLEAKLKAGNMLFVPQLSLTSGDGRNSFGTDSRDVDRGGVKYSGRLDFYPLGEFEGGSLRSIADVEHQSQLRMVLGIAGSYNDGASGAVGESHGDFTLYNAIGESQLPDYRQWFADLLMKYRGFSFLGEFGIASATSLEALYLNQSLEDPLLATQIGEYLALGSAYNLQLGYVTKGGYGLDLRYSAVQTEFELNNRVLLPSSTAYSIGLSKYLKGHSLKLQSIFSLLEPANGTQQEMRIGLLAQLVF